MIDIKSMPNLDPEPSDLLAMVCYFATKIKIILCQNVSSATSLRLRYTLHMETFV